MLLICFRQIFLGQALPERSLLLPLLLLHLSLPTKTESYLKSLTLVAIDSDEVERKSECWIGTHFKGDFDVGSR